MIDNHTFLKFHSLDFPKDSIGLEWGGNYTTYFCTPVGAEVIGWLGVDEIRGRE